MAALATLVVVWLGAEKPEGRAKAALEEWAATRHFALETPREPADERDGSRAVAESCDRDLETARDRLTGGDDEAARQTLSSVEQVLRDHPELLQASWLMAERYRLEAQIAARRGESAASWQERADVLEGERALGFGEPRRAPAKLAELTVSIVVHGARSHETYWDGARTEDRISTSRGEHHLAILRGKRVAWSGWVSALAPTSLDVWIADAPPCSYEDVAGAAFGADAVRTPPGVRCPSWAAAGPGATPGTMRIALCEKDVCRPASTWAYEIFPSAGRSPDVAKKGLPAWATWTIVGAGVAAATSVILWQSGAFERAAPEKRVVYDGSGL